MCVFERECVCVCVCVCVVFIESECAAFGFCVISSNKVGGRGGWVAGRKKRE